MELSEATDNERDDIHDRDNARYKDKGSDSRSEASNLLGTVFAPLLGGLNLHLC